ncbi:MAG: ureidoglycolate lyase [Hyphomicrobiales bacterium]
MQTISIQPLTKAAFAPFGDVIEFEGDPSFAINNGMCDRYHGLAHPVITDADGHTAISLGRARPYALPLTLKMMERHPLGSQAFIPLQPHPFLVVVAPNEKNAPAEPVAFITEIGQGVNYHCNIWHAVLTPLDQQTDFVIIDRFGEGDNLEEHHFDQPYLVGQNS